MHCKSPVEALDRDGDQWIVTVAGRNSRFNAVILALPSYAAGALLAKVDSRLATELEQIQYSSSITVNLVYDTATLPRLEGFGFLVPRIEGRNLLAVTYTHNKFPHRAGPGKSLLRCFFGGESASQVLALDDGAVAEMAQHDVEQVLGFRTAPVTTRVNRWNRAMAQYGVGHLARVAEIERLRRQLPGLGLAGNAYRGIGVPDAIRTGADAAREVTKVSQPATSGRV
jgi:oxygen-dependent protoporphyrinogen oxidase